MSCRILETELKKIEYEETQFDCQLCGSDSRSRLSIFRAERPVRCLLTKSGGKRSLSEGARVLREERSTHRRKTCERTGSDQAFRAGGAEGSEFRARLRGVIPHVVKSRLF